MKLNRTVLSSALAAGLVLTVSAASAQTEETAEEAPAAEETEEGEEVAQAEEAEPMEEEAAVEEEPMEESAEAEANMEADTEGGLDLDAEAEAESEAEPEEVEEAEEEGGSPSLFVFADAWAGWQSAKSGTIAFDPTTGEPIAAGGGVYANNGPNGTPESGFGLNWLGADLGYDGGMWAVNGSLRWGDAVAIYGTGTLGPITNAYVTFRPVDGLSLDMGTFGTIYGAEVAESWQNLNYTRGELYFNMQPFWHTGLRAEYATGNFVVRGLVVNDANTSNLGTGALNAGLQVGYDNAETFGVYLGGLQSLKPDTTAAAGGFVDTFFDAVVWAALGDLSIVGNFDMVAGYEDGISSFWGASLAAGYQFVPAFGAAVRGEYLASSDGFLYGTDEDSLATVTLTLDTKPVPEVDNFIVRLDGRMEFASEDVYLNGDASDVTSSWTSITLGVVGYADLL